MDKQFEKMVTRHFNRVQTINKVMVCLYVHEYGIIVDPCIDKTKLKIEPKDLLEK